MRKKKNSSVEDPIYNEEFSFIAGYTEGGVPFGTTWEEVGISTDLPLEQRVKLLISRYETQKNKYESEEINVYLEDIAEKFEECMEDWEQYLNIKTGEFVTLPSSFNDYVDLDDEDEKLAEEIEFSDDYVRLPDQYDLHEYDIMWDFASDYSDRSVGSKLQQILNRKKPYRHFKDAINYYGIADLYYKYRSNAFLELARSWCEDYSIRYKRKNIIDESDIQF